MSGNASIIEVDGQLLAWESSEYRRSVILLLLLLSHTAGMVRSNMIEPDANRTLPTATVRDEPAPGFDLRDEYEFNPLFILNENDGVYKLNPIFKFSEDTFDDSAYFEKHYSFEQYSLILAKLDDLLNGNLDLGGMSEEEIAVLNRFIVRYIGGISAADMNVIIDRFEGSDYQRLGIARQYKRARLQYLFRMLNPRYFKREGPPSPGYAGWLGGANLDYMGEHGVERFISLQQADPDRIKQLLVLLYSFLEESSEHSDLWQRVQNSNANPEILGLKQQLLNSYGVDTAFELPLYQDQSFDGVYELRAGPAVWQQIEDWGVNPDLINEIRNRKVVFDLSAHGLYRGNKGLHTDLHIGLRLNGEKVDAGIAIHEIAHTNHPTSESMKDLINMTFTFLEDSSNSESYPKFYNILQGLVYGNNHALMPTAYKGILSKADQVVNSFLEGEVDDIDGLSVKLPFTGSVNPVKEFWATFIQSIFLMISADEIPEDFKPYVSMILNLERYEPIAPEYYDYEPVTAVDSFKLAVFFLLLVLSFKRTDKQVEEQEQGN